MSMHGKKRPLDGETEPVSTVNIKVKGQDQREVFFKIKRDAPLGKLLNAYCEKVHVDPRTMVFLYEGEHRILSKETPNKLGMQDGDEIDALTESGGGGGGGGSMTILVDATRL